MRVTFFEMPELGKCWERKNDSCLLWPENPKIPAKEIWQNIFTGDTIVRRYNMEGELLFSNEEDYGYSIAF